MPNDTLQNLLNQLSAQTGRPMPSADDVQSFLNQPGSQLLLQSVLGSKSDTLHAAASLARSGDYSSASQLVQQYLTSSEGQQLLQKLSQNGGRL